MKIFVYKRGGDEWADFKMPDDATLIRAIEVPDRVTAEKHLKRETGRIAALLERARDELPAEEKQSILGRVVSLFKR